MKGFKKKGVLKFFTLFLIFSIIFNPVFFFSSLFLRPKFRSPFFLGTSSVVRTPHGSGKRPKTGLVNGIAYSKNCDCEVPRTEVETRMEVRVKVEVEVDQTPSDTLLHFYSRLHFCRDDYRKCAS